MTVILPSPQPEELLHLPVRLSSFVNDPNASVSTRIIPKTLIMQDNNNGTNPGSKKAIESNYLRAMARITSLEKAIEFQKEQHLETTKSLKQEVSRLQTLCSELTLRLMLSGANTDVINWNESEFRNALMAALPRSTTVDEKAVKNETKLGLKTLKMGVFPTEAKDAVNDSNPPLHLLVEKERRKYQGMIERITEENKRKSQELERLKSEMDVVRDVLGIAGVKFDLKEFQKLSEKKGSIRKKSFASWPKVLQSSIFTAKHPVLPPITGEEIQESVLNEGQNTLLHIQQGSPTEPINDGKTRKGSGKIRAARYASKTCSDQTNQINDGAPISLESHNPNLDYDHRVQKGSYPCNAATNLDPSLHVLNSNESRRRAPSNSTSLVSWGDSTIKPDYQREEYSLNFSDVRVKQDMSKDCSVLDEVIPDSSKSSSQQKSMIPRKDGTYAHHVFRARLIREKQLKDAADQAK